MKALILNSGIGKRMGDFTSQHPKCMSVIEDQETILSRQLKQLWQCDISEIAMTIGPFDKALIEYCNSLKLPLRYKFVHNPVYDQTNYIYSIYLARNDVDDDIILLHGDLVFERSVLMDMLMRNASCMSVSSTVPLPQKDFKAVVEGDLIKRIGVDFFESALTAQPLYKMNRVDWKIWLDRIVEYCEKGRVSFYAENAFNEISDQCLLYAMDYRNRLCAEVDTPKDLVDVAARLKESRLAGKERTKDE